MKKNNKQKKLNIYINHGNQTNKTFNNILIY